MVKELRDQPFLLLRNDHCFRDTAIDLCKHARLIPQVVFESGQFASIFGMVAAGLGISIVPEMALEKRPDCTSILIADEPASRTVGVAYLKGLFLSRAPRAFLEHLRSQAQVPAAATG